MAAVLGCVTVNPARILKIFPQKGTLSVGSDADMVVMDEKMNIEKVFAMGEMLLDNGKPIKKGKYEG
ncbi:MAG TPA: amidohydrolase family protein [Clostridia bacterium]|nr:amidohydrolase family protein [Clostridia bacterium]